MRSQDFLWECTFFLKKLITFLVVVLNTHAESAQLTIPTLQSCRVQQKFYSKIDFFFRLLGAFTTFPYKLTPKIFYRPGGEHLHPLYPLPLATPCFYIEYNVSTFGRQT